MHGFIQLHSFNLGLFLALFNHDRVFFRFEKFEKFENLRNHIALRICPIKKCRGLQIGYTLLITVITFTAVVGYVTVKYSSDTKNSKGTKNSGSNSHFVYR
jgi:hypothetical protein